MNETLALDEDEAAAESPVLCTPIPGIPVTCWTGAVERPEFLRQSQILVEAWAGQSDIREAVYEPGRHHYNVVEGLKQPNHPLTEALIG